MPITHPPRKDAVLLFPAHELARIRTNGRVLVRTMRLVESVRAILLAVANPGVGEASAGAVDKNVQQKNRQVTMSETNALKVPESYRRRFRFRTEFAKLSKPDFYPDAVFNARR